MPIDPTLELNRASSELIEAVEQAIKANLPLPLSIMLAYDRLSELKGEGGLAKALGVRIGGCGPVGT